jgi:hypothetical protein
VPESTPLLLCLKAHGETFHVITRCRPLSPWVSAVHLQVWPQGSLASQSLIILYKWSSQIASLLVQANYPRWWICIADKIM